MMITEQPNIVDVTDGFDPNYAELLAQQLKSSHGRLKVYVHTFFDLFSELDPEDIPSERYIHLLNDSIAGHEPALFLEERKNIHRLKSLSPLSTKSDMFVVTTETARPTISDYHHNWQRLTSQLHRLGVSEVFIEGQLYYYDEFGNFINNFHLSPIGLSIASSLLFWHKNPLLSMFPHAKAWISQGKIPYACVGKAGWMFLNAGFDVDFSDVVSPNKELKIQDY